MKKVVIISYAFPPVGGGGVQRSVKFVKYLRGLNWEPLVLTVANPSVPLVDLKLAKDIPIGTRIYKAKTFEPSYDKKTNFSRNPNPFFFLISGYIKKILSNLLLPDFQVLWWPGLIPNLLRILKKDKPHCIFVSAPPFSTFIPVVAIGKIFNTPVVIDYRDEWTYARSQLENLSKSRFAQKLDYYFEKYCLKYCSAFTTASEGYVENLTMRYNLKDQTKGICITNGFDEDDFNMHRQETKKNNTMINIVFSGTVWKGTSLKNFFSALDQLFKKVPAVRNKLKIRVFGRIVDSELSSFQTEVLQDVIEIGGYINHNDIINEISNADILLLSIADTPGADRIILGKTFEYMATGKHILALLPTGELERLLKNTYGNATIVEPGDIDKISNTILMLIDNIDAVRLYTSKDVSRFSRKKLTEKLTDVLNSVTSGQIN